jgi:hypothetical protein
MMYDTLTRLEEMDGWVVGWAKRVPRRRICRAVPHLYNVGCSYEDRPDPN